MFEQFFGVLYRFALLSDQLVEFFGAKLALDTVAFVPACVVNQGGRPAYAIGYVVILVKGGKAVEL